MRKCSNVLWKIRGASGIKSYKCGDKMGTMSCAAAVQEGNGVRMVHILGKLNGARVVRTLLKSAAVQMR